MSGSDETIKDTNSLFEEITNRNPNFQNIRYISNILEKIKVFYSNNIRSISEETLKKKIKAMKPRTGILKIHQSKIVPSWPIVMLMRFVEPEIMTTNKRIIANEIS